MKFGIQNSKFGIGYVLVSGAMLVLAACSEMGERDNPLDPSASNYVGSDTIINADDNGDSSDSRNDASSSSVNESSSVSSSSSTKNSSSNSEKTEISYGNFTDERDNQVYKTIKIGNQVWMAKNLNYKAENSYCYDDKDSYCDRYGRLYTWNSAMNACPEGWHLPTKAEWETLFDFVGGDDVAGEKLKSADGSTNWYKKSSDAYGFSFLPNGGRYDMGDDGGIAYYSAGYEGKMWSSTEEDPGIAFMFQFGDDNKLTWIADPSQNAFGVRCLATSGASGKSSSSEGSVESSGSSSSTSQEATDSSSSVKSSSSTQSSSSSFDIKEYLNPNISYGEITDGRDGQVYKTVVIGGLTWMAQNLNFETENSVCQDDKEENCARLGRLYMWNDAIDSAGKYGDKGKGCGNKTLCETPAYEMIRGICPKGFHLPTAAEFSQLISIAGADVIKIKSQKTWKITGSDDFGFSAVQSGRKIKDIWHPGEAYMWSTSQVNKFAARALQAVEGEGWGPLLDVSGGSSKDEFYSVRCLQDYEVFGTLTDERDDKVYKTAKIGSQNWMIENLNYAYVQRTKTEDSSSFCLNNLPENCDKYGRLYLWSAAMDSAALFSESGKMCGDQDECSPSYPVRGVCPKGWHLPTSEDFKELGAGGGYALKSKSGWINGENGSDYYGFNAYPAGAKGFVGDDCTNALGYDKCENSVDYWSATEHDYASALRFGIGGGDNNDAKQTTTEGKVYALSVRCIED